VRLFNKFCSIYLIASSSALGEFARLTPVASDAICIDYQTLPLTDEHRVFLNKSILKTFWQEATERYLVLYDFMNRFNIQHVFHLENDVLIYVNLAELLSGFRSKYSIAVPFDNDTRAISSFVYVKDSTCLQKMVAFFAEKTAQGLNDMYILPSIKKIDTSIVGQLPIIMPEYARYYPLINISKERAQNPIDYTSNFGSFNCVFDAAALGQYLGGISPKCGAAGPGFINEACLFDPSRLSYVWENNHDGLLVPYAVFKGKKYLIANLHVHSKNLACFSSDRDKQVNIKGDVMLSKALEAEARIAKVTKSALIIDQQKKVLPNKNNRLEKRIICVRK
jgi:hypothetical protein